MANEDTRLEVALLSKKPEHIISVCGSGGRVLPLLASAPKEVTLVDLSQEQLYLAELRFATLRQLNYEEFLTFWGYPPRSASAKERQTMFTELDLSQEAQDYLASLFAENNWESILYLGKWERTIAKLAKANRLLTRDAGIGLFGNLSTEEQERYLNKRFPRKAWLAVVALLGNAGVFNALIYKGHFPKKNIPGTFFSFYRDTLDRCFNQGLVRENFFLQLLFFGKIIFQEGVTAEADPTIFAAAKAGIKKCKVNFVKNNIIDTIAEAKRPADFVSLSDVPSYFSGATERQFLQKIKSGLADDAMVVLRHYLHVPEQCDRRGYKDVTNSFKAAIAAEKVQVYKVEVLKRTGR